MVQCTTDSSAATQDTCAEQNVTTDACGKRNISHDACTEHSSTQDACAIDLAPAPDACAKTSPSYDLNLCQRLRFGCGHVLNDLCASMWFSYLLMYYHKVLNFSNELAGYVMLLGQVSDALCTPFIGYESDRTKGCGNYGQRKTWHLIGCICVLLSFPFLFLRSPGWEASDDWAQFIYYAPLVVVFQFGWASTQLSHLSLIPELTPKDSVRLELNAIRYAFTVMSSISVYVAAWLFLGMEADDKLNAADDVVFRNLAAVVVCLGLASVVVFHVGVKEKAQDYNRSKPRRGKQTADNNDRGNSNTKENITAQSQRNGNANNGVVNNGDVTNCNTNNGNINNGVTNNRNINNSDMNNGGMNNDSEPSDKSDNNGADCRLDNNNRNNCCSCFNTKDNDTNCVRGNRFNCFKSKDNDNNNVCKKRTNCPNSNSNNSNSNNSNDNNINNSNSNDNNSNSNNTNNNSNDNDNSSNNTTEEGPEEGKKVDNEGGSDVGIAITVSERRHVGVVDWLREPQFYQVAVVYMSTRLVVNLSQIYMPMYLTDSLLLPKNYIAIVPLVVYISGFFTSCFMKILNRLIGRKVMYILGGVIVICACVWLYFLRPGTTWQVIFPSIFLGIGCSTILVTSLALLADLIGSNTSSGAFVYGAMSFTDKLSNGIAVVIIQNLQPCAEDVVECPDTMWYYRNTMAFVPASMSVAGIVGIVSLWPYVIGDLRLFKGEDQKVQTQEETQLDIQQLPQNTNCANNDTKAQTVDTGNVGVENSDTVASSSSEDVVKLDVANDNTHAEVDSVATKDSVTLDVASDETHAEVDGIATEDSLKLDVANDNTHAEVDSSATEDSLKLDVANDNTHAEVGGVATEDSLQLDVANDNTHAEVDGAATKDSVTLDVANDKTHAEVDSVATEDSLKLDAADDNTHVQVYDVATDDSLKLDIADGNTCSC